MGSPGNPSPVIVKLGTDLRWRIFEAHANGPREDDIRRHSIGEAQSQNPWQPAVRKFEDHKDDQPDADDAQPQDQQALQ